MKRFALIPLLAFAALTSVFAESAADNQLTPQEKADGWQLLFDGKDASQWRGFKSDKLPGAWEVKDGAIVLKGGGGTDGGDIVTKEQYGSFEIQFDYKISKGGNSGLMFHVTEAEGAPFVTGPEVQILDNADAGDPNKAGWLYALYTTDIDPSKPAGEWNHLRVKIDGAHGENWLNGKKMVEYEMWTPDWDARVAKSKFGAWPAFGKAKVGHIDLQDHGAHIEFKNIKIKNLDKK